MKQGQFDQKAANLGQFKTLQFGFNLHVALSFVSWRT